MDVAISICSDLVILLFDISLYIKLTTLKKDNKFYRGMIYGVVGLLTVMYIIAQYVFHVGYAAASFLCMSLPSFILFFCVSKYKNSRFIVTFCFVDTVTYIIAFCSKVAAVKGGEFGEIISLAVLFLLCNGIYFLVRPYCAKYRKLMEQVSNGWGPMAVSGILVYVLLVLTAAYPVPMIQRQEYLWVYAFLCITVLSFYGVFLSLVMQKAKLTQMNEALKQQKHWQYLAYIDELTQLSNHAAYDARTTELEREEEHEKPCHVILFDIDNFKHVNDTYGHHYGDKVLQKTGSFFRETFADKRYEFFRVGGDEFAAIATDIPEEEIREKVQMVNAMKAENDIGCTYSCGYSTVDFKQRKAFEQAFIQADAAMYAVKNEKKKQQK